MIYNCIICDKNIKILKTHIKNSHKDINYDLYMSKYPLEQNKYKVFMDETLIDRQKNSPNSIHFYLNKGLSVDNAKIAYDEYNKNNAFRNKDVSPMQYKYWMKKGHNEKESKELAKINNSRSLKDLIKIHGKEKALLIREKWMKSLDKRKNSEIDNYIIKYDTDLETAEKIFKQRRKDASIFNYKNWMKKGYSKNDSLDIVSNLGKKYSKRCLNHWIEKGYNKKESLKKISKHQDLNSIKSLMKRKSIDYSSAINYQNSIILKTINTNIKNKKIIDIYNQDMSIFNEYINIVNHYTDMSYRKYKHIIDPLNKRSINYHLDHKYSKIKGFINNINPEIIGSECNLEIIKAEDNLRKGVKCSIKKHELIKEYNIKYNITKI